MGTLVQIWNSFWDYFREGFAHINPIQGVVIAIIGGLMVNGVFAVFFIPLLAMVVHVAADVLVPVVLGHAAFVMPPFDPPFVHYLVTLYVAYFVAIGAIYLLRTLFASARGR